MKIIINGTEKNIGNNTSLKEIINEFSPKNDRVITELNGQIISKDHWGATLINEGDTLELVAFVGGG